MDQRASMEPTYSGLYCAMTSYLKEKLSDLLRRTEVRMGVTLSYLKLALSQ